MPLDTQTFPLERYWLVAALNSLPAEPRLFARSEVVRARKVFLAGTNQLAAIKNWLSAADIITLGRGKAGATLTDLGRLLRARDPRAERAWTWWLVHLHLAANAASLPYSTFFCSTETGGGWMTAQDAVDVVRERIAGSESELAESTLKTYFAGVESAFRPGMALYDLQILERRRGDDGTGAFKLRRVAVEPNLGVVAYATFLFHDRYFGKRTTVDAKELLAQGLSRALGLTDRRYRQALDDVHHDKDLGEWIHYKHAVNLDSVQFTRSGEPALEAIRKRLFSPGMVKWA